MERKIQITGHGEDAQGGYYLRVLDVGEAERMRAALKEAGMKETIVESGQDGTNASVKESYYDPREEAWLAALRSGPRKPSRSDDAEVTHELVGRLLGELRAQREHTETLGTALAQAVEDRARLRKSLSSSLARERAEEAKVRERGATADAYSELINRLEDALHRQGFVVPKSSVTGEHKRTATGELLVTKRRDRRWLRSRT